MGYRGQLKISRLGGYEKICDFCPVRIWMQELPDGTWMACENYDRIKKHNHIISRVEF